MMKLVKKPKNRKLGTSLPETFADNLREVISCHPFAENEADGDSRLKTAQQYLRRSKPTNFDIDPLDPHCQ